LAIVPEGRSRTGRARIDVINRATTGAGDCEDYAIAKYVALMEAGIAAANLRVVIVHDLVVGASHAIVAVYIDGAWLTLDNRWMALVDDRDMRRVTPQFVLGRDGAKQFVPATASDAKQKAPQKLNS
jgi:hypothetical protein